MIEICVFCAYPNKNRQNVFCQHTEGVHNAFDCKLFIDLYERWKPLAYVNGAECKACVALIRTSCVLSFGYMHDHHNSTNIVFRLNPLPPSHFSLLMIIFSLSSSRLSVKYGHCNDILHPLLVVIVSLGSSKLSLVYLGFT